MAIQWDFIVGVQTGGVTVETLGHLNLGPNVVFGTLDLYLWSVPSFTGGHGRPPGKPWKTTEASYRAQENNDAGERPETIYKG